MRKKTNPKEIEETYRFQIKRLHGTLGKDYESKYDTGVKK